VWLSSSLDEKKGKAAQKEALICSIQSSWLQEVKQVECIMIRSRPFNFLENKQSNLANNY
jgi:hypothetical protein